MSRLHIVVPAACLLAACASRTVPQPQTASPSESCYVGRRLPALDDSETSSVQSHDRKTLAPFILRHSAEVRRCYETHGLASNPALTGKVIFRWLISETGRVAWSGVQESSLGSEAVEACMGNSICAWTFPPSPGGGPTIVNFPFAFMPP